MDQQGFGLLALATAVLAIESPASAQETCYVSMAISTERDTTTSRKTRGQIDEARDVPLVVFHTNVFEAPCPERHLRQPAKQDVRVQFYEAIKARYPQMADQIRGAWRDLITISSQKDYVFEGHGWWEPQGPYDDSHDKHSIIEIDDFSYEPWGWRNSNQKGERYQTYSKWKFDKKYVDRSR